MARGNAISGALAGRGIARNAEAYARPVLLLVAATAIAVYSVEFDRTWTLSQRDQVAHDMAADIRGTVAGDRRPLLQAAEAYRAVPGMTMASPVIRDTFDLGPDLSSGRLLALPSGPAFGDGATRSDLADRSLAGPTGRPGGGPARPAAPSAPEGYDPGPGDARQFVRTGIRERAPARELDRHLGRAGGAGCKRRPFAHPRRRCPRRQQRLRRVAPW